MGKIIRPSKDGKWKDEEDDEKVKKKTKNKLENCNESTRSFYDNTYDTTLNEEKYTNCMPTSVRFTSKDLSFFQSIIDTKKSPELKNVSVLVRSFTRKQSQTWWQEQDFSENELHQATKNFIKTTDKIMQELSMKNTIIEQVGLVLHTYQPDIAKKVIAKSIHGFSDSFMMWIYDAIDEFFEKKTKRGRISGFDKNTLHRMADQVKQYLKETDWLEDEYEKP